MPISARLVLLFSAFLPLTTQAQTAAPKPVRCTVQASAPATEADRALASGDSAHAETLFTSQIATTPSAYIGLVHSQLEQSKLPEALATAKRAETAEPNAATPQILLGEVFTRSGLIPEASAAFSKALTFDQCSPRAHFGLGKLNELVSRHAAAAHELALAHGLSPTDPEITAVWLETLNAPQRAAALNTLLASDPLLGPTTIERLQTELAILIQHKSCTATEAASTLKLQLLPVMFNGKYERSWGLSVRLNDASPALLELDTSVSGIVLNPGDAQRAGVHPLTRGPATPTSPYNAVADHVRIGNVEFRDCPVRVVSASDLAGANSLIGADFFRDHLIHIDYVAQLLTLSPYPERPGLDLHALADQFVAPDEKDWSPVYIAGAKILVPSLINKKGPYLFLLDTGIGRTIFSPALTTSLLSSTTDATVNLQGTSGNIVKVMPREAGPELDRVDVRGPNHELLRVTRPVKVPVLRFTTNERTDLSSVSFDISPQSHAAGTEISGLLGFFALRNYFIDINYRDGLARILFDQNRRYEAREQQKNNVYAPLN